MTPASDRNETCPTWTFASAYKYLQALPRQAWKKGYRVRVLNVLSRIAQAPDTPPKWDDVWFTCLKNCGDGSLAEAKRLLSLHDAAPTPAPREEAHGEVVLWRFHGTAGFRTPAWNEMYCYEGCGCRPYVAVPLAQREAERRRIKTLEDDANRLQRDRDACLDEIRRVYEAIGVDPFKDRFTTCAADVAAKLAALRGKEAPRG